MDIENPLENPPENPSTPKDDTHTDSCPVTNSFDPSNLPPPPNTSTSTPTHPSMKGILSLLPPTLNVPAKTTATSIDSSTLTETPTASWISSHTYILLYFSASWCKPCQHFSPKLSSFLLSNPTCGCLYVSHDTTHASMLSSLASKPYASFTSLTSPTARTCKSLLGQVLSVNMLPTVVVVEARTGKRITSWG
eukprot:CAMPEP_0118659562 /NCGR_PEP_ID=MMETSP0785-20121206/15181_1 /TAXON_ID=91992 /ORGANISM="Bolidomonas pacifica, Strain CCMP 1866" /LENGTH=192 /DNA_ID=CAMNT_0006552681 /DNA_START=112 /DNA_END=686 /DNA_ORIENTATION=-